MDEKKFEAGGQAPQENQNTQENINNQSGAAQQNAQQNAGSSESGSGWVFSDKNVSGAHQQDESGTSQQPNQEGWYRSGPQQNHEQAGQDQNQNPAYSSRYSYGESASSRGSRRRTARTAPSPANIINGTMRIISRPRRRKVSIPARRKIKA